ncbi:unnamed protein product [Symbiodinium natans]|uniref:Uncharacterized protein n=1 Tax=Symbiodinium natans TaxID=878477 RepID=A0A812TBX4_9DINO|nr:unnamed protein product [Symbiodinium natans]
MPGSGPGLAPEGDEAADGLPPAPAGAPKAKEAARKKTQKAETSLSTTVQAQGRLLAAQAEQLSEQAEKLALQDQRIHHLEQRLAGLWEEGLPGRSAEVVADVVEDNQVSDVIEVKLVTSHAEDEGQLQELTAVYEFEQSMWDATLLLFFSKATNAMDQAVLLFGFILNLVLQLALLITVSYIMLENPYTQQTVQEMLAWRVRSGHAEPNFDDSSGKSLLTRLCNQELWSYEQAEFKLMYDYLYKDVPGYILSSLAIIMWILTVMVEFRRCVEQALAVIHLPAIVPPEVAAVHDAAGKIAIQGIQPTKRCMALAMLSVPRFAVMLWLALFGCQYLAQTVNLQDIVLNAVALAFIMDVDELIAHVLLTERLRSMLPRIRPLPCVATIRRGGPSTPMCCPPKDLVRYVLTAGCVVAKRFIGCRL